MDENHSITLGDKQVIERTAELVFESFHSDNCVLGIVSKQSGYVASRPNVFAQAFNGQNLLSIICGRVDDGDEPLITYVNGLLIVSAGLTVDNCCIGYAVLILQDYTSEQAIGCLEFIEIILNQVSTVAGQVWQNMQLANPVHTSADSYPN